jgi:type III secretion system HrpB2-like protein
MLVPHFAISPVRAADTSADSVVKVGETSSDVTSSRLANVSPATEEAAADFKAMMENVKLSPDRGASARHQDSAVGKIVAQQDAVMGDIGRDIERFQHNASTLSPSEYAAQSVQIQFKMAEIMTTIEMGVGFAQGGKSAVQNLMKNQ